MNFLLICGGFAGMFLGRGGGGDGVGSQANLGRGKEPSQTPKFLSPSPGVFRGDRGLGVAPPPISLAARRGDGFFWGEKDKGRDLTPASLGRGKEPSQTPKFLSPSPGVFGGDRRFCAAPPPIPLAARRFHGRPYTLSPPLLILHFAFRILHFTRTPASSVSPPWPPPEPRAPYRNPPPGSGAWTRDRPAP